MVERRLFLRTQETRRVVLIKEKLTAKLMKGSKLSCLFLINYSPTQTYLPVSFIFEEGILKF